MSNALRLVATSFLHVRATVRHAGRPAVVESRPYRPHGPTRLHAVGRAAPRGERLGWSGYGTASARHSLCPHSYEALLPLQRPAVSAAR